MLGNTYTGEMGVKAIAREREAEAEQHRMLRLALESRQQAEPAHPFSLLRQFSTVLARS